jgi:phosphatidate cytidylyltransferase
MKRILTAAVILPVVILITVFAPDWIFALVVAAFASIAVDEFLSLAGKRGIGRPGRWFLASAVAMVMSFLGGLVWVATVLVVSALVLMTTAVFQRFIDNALGTVGMGLAALVYCPLMLGFLVLMPRGRILLLFAIIWIGDTAAYYCGRAFGRHALAPVVSPKKTVEGAIAGLIGSVLAGVVGGVWFLGNSWTDLIWISAVIAIVGQIGDLAESVLKRSAAVKDSSSIMPGHGGILDRLDSLFFAAPVFYWLMNS